MVKKTKINLDDLIHAAKCTAHSINGASDLAQQEFKLITNVVELPDWDEIEPQIRIKILDECWKQLEEEGYEYTGK